MSLPVDAPVGVALGILSCFRVEFYACLYKRADVLFEITDALLCTQGPVKTLVDLSLAAEHRRGHGAMYAALDRGWLEPTRLRRALAALPIPRLADGRIAWRWTFPTGSAPTLPPAMTACSATSTAAAAARTR